MFNAREGSNFLKYVMLFKISSSFFYTQKVAYFVQKQVILIRSNPTYLRCITDQTRSNMTNLRCTADHHSVLPLNIRPVESGTIPDHFSTGWKTDPAHHDLSERARPTPAVF